MITVKHICPNIGCGLVMPDGAEFQQIRAHIEACFRRSVAERMARNEALQRDRITVSEGDDATAHAA